MEIMTAQVKPKNTNRKIYLDVLRILAIFLVLFAHTGKMGTKLYMTTNNRMLKTIYLYLECFRTINNSLLFMISGALLLQKDEPLKVVWKKRVLRFVAVLVIFTYLQAILQCLETQTLSNFSISSVFIQMLTKPITVSYWYLYTYLSFLIVLPFIRSIARKMDCKTAIYLFVVSIVTQDIFTILRDCLGIGTINISLFTNLLYVSYPLLGYYIDTHYEEFRKCKYFNPALMAIAFLGLSAAVYFTVHDYRENGNWSEKYIVLFCTITTVGAFCAVKELTHFLSYKNFLSNKAMYLLEVVSSATFGIYLTENILERITIYVYRFLSNFMPSIIACGIYLMATMTFGTIVISMLKRIPVLKRLL